MTEIPIPDPPDDADGVHRVGFLRRMRRQIPRASAR